MSRIYHQGSGRAFVIISPLMLKVLISGFCSLKYPLGNHTQVYFNLDLILLF